eukprot:7760976-Pyramimonas_sp.AAC.1
MLTVLLLTICDQAPVEATHASLRRWLHGLSVQTHVPRHEFISACRLIQGFRRRLKVTRPGGSRGLFPKKGRESGRAAPPRKVRKPGGVQRAFFSEQLSLPGPAKTMGELHAELKRIRTEEPERFADLLEKGQDATA